MADMLAQLWFWVADAVEGRSLYAVMTGVVFAAAIATAIVIGV